MRVSNRNNNRLRNIALLGLLPVLAVLVYQYFGGTQQLLTLNEPQSSAPFTLLTEDQLAEYTASGFVVVRGMFPPEQRDALVRAGEDYYHKFNVLDYVFAAIFAKLGTQLWRAEQQFAEAALLGALPAISAQLLGHPQSVRLLKDGFFGLRSNNNTGCGFHQDDRFFWPTTDGTTGVNFWVALSDISAAEGGGIRVVHQSALDPEIARECLEVIRTTDEAPQKLTPTTCRMHELSPSCHDKLMEASVVHDLAPGDALVWDRRTFHRTEPFRVVSEEEPKLRYTVRYVPEGTVAEGTLHPSVEQGQEFETSLHPRVWPSMLPHEKSEIEKGLGSDTPVLPILYRMIQSKVVG